MNPVLEHSPTPPIDEQEPTRDGLIDVVEDLPLVRDPNTTQEERCSRCQRKNDIRRGYELPQRDETFRDGERVRLFVAYDTDPRTTSGWQVRGVYHTDHPQLSEEKAAVPSVIQAQVTATLEQSGWTYEDPFNEGNEHTNEDASVVRDVEIEWFSPADEGQEREPVADVDDDGVASPQATDPIPTWPDEENEWRREIIQELGDAEA